MKKFFTLLFAALVGSTLTLSAQEEVTSADIEALNNRIEELEAKLDKQAQRAEKWGKVVDKLPKVSGFAKLGYTWNDAGTSQFGIQYVRISLAGDLGKKFDYKLQVELASPKLIDAYVRWKVNPAFNVQFGQFHVPFSLEGPLSPTKWETIESAMVVDEITGLPDTRDLGMQFYGQFAKLEEDGHYLFDYGIGIFQGEGKNKKDANKSKDVIGRLKFFPTADLCLTGSFSYGERGEDYTVNQRAAAGVEWKPENWILRSEYLWHKQGSGDASIYNEGFYVVAMRQIKKFAPVVRYNFYNQKTSRLDQSDYVVGLNYFPVKNLKLQVNYTLTTFSGDTAHNINTVGFAAVAMF